MIVNSDGYEYRVRTPNKGHDSAGGWLCSSCGASYDNSVDVPSKEYLDARWGIRVFTSVPKQKFRVKEHMQRDVVKTKNGSFAIVCATVWDEALAEKYGCN